jgi:hypothetical protein
MPDTKSLLIPLGSTPGAGGRPGFSGGFGAEQRRARASRVGEAWGRGNLGPRAGGGQRPIDFLSRWAQSLSPFDTSGSQEHTCRDAFRDYAFA